MTGIHFHFPDISEAHMIRDLQLTVGDICGDSTGLRVRVDEIDTYNRVHFSVIEEVEDSWITGEMSRDAFMHRFLRLYSTQRKAA